MTVRDVDSGRLLSRSPPGPAPIETLLVVRRPAAFERLPSRLPDLRQRIPFPVTASPPTGGRSARRASGQALDTVAAAETRGTHGPRVTASWLFGRTDVENFLSRQLFAGPGRFEDLAWSPDGGWLLVGWRDADQWLFLRPSSDRVRAVGHISRQFDPGATGKPPFPGHQRLVLRALIGWPEAQLSPAIPGGGRGPARPRRRSVARRWRAWRRSGA